MISRAVYAANVKQVLLGMPILFRPEEQQEQWKQVEKDDQERHPYTSARQRFLFRMQRNFLRRSSLLSAFAFRNSAGLL
jgi:hypothetical protein